MRLLFFAVLLTMVLLAGCSGDNDSGTVDLALTEDDLGDSFNVKVGQTVSLTLPENPSTGYSWHKSWAPEDALDLTLDAYDPDGAADGGGGNRNYVFEALKSGTVVITVQYGRWWEGGEREDPQTVTLVVAP